VTEFLSRNVKKETDEQYRGGWPYSADARRNLYLKYAAYPEDIATMRQENVEQTAPRDMWKEIARKVIDRAGNTPDTEGLDIGSSSGYFIRQLLEEDYKGKITGVDIETVHQPFLQQQLLLDYPTAKLRLGKANAQSLREVSVIDDGQTLDKFKIQTNSFDFVTELFVLYHVPIPERAYDSAHRVVKPDGIVVFSGRGPLNQQHLWNLGSTIAENLNTEAPASFYNHHSLDDMENYLSNSSKYEVLEKITQADHLWIPNDEEGWLDYKEALMSLRPFMKDKATQHVINGKTLSDYLDSYVRPVMFESQAANNSSEGRYFIDFVFQNFYICRAIK
jgi:SAM-dependent methyltransferase